MWNTTNGLGQQVTWYSEEEVEKYRQALIEIRKRLYIVKDDPITLA